MSLDEGGDALLIRREAAGITIERIAAAEHAWLAALAAAAPLGTALDRAQATGKPFDFAAVLRARIGDGTIVGVNAS